MDQKQREREMAESVIEDVEAERHATRNTDLEGDLSIKDWVDRIANATKQAAKLARQPLSQLEYEAWVELAAIVVGRAEFVAWAEKRAECAHDWPRMHEPHSRCLLDCGLMYGELSS